MSRTLSASSLLSLLFLAAALSTWSVAGAAVTTTKHFCYSTPSLLGGDLTSCRMPANTTVCKGGYASSEAWVRYFRSKGEPTLHLFPLDYLSSFAQMHALSWDVNAPFYAHYNVNAWIAMPSILASVNNPQLNQIRRSGIPWVLTNIAIPPDNQFCDFRKLSWVDPETQIGYLVFGLASDVRFAFAAVPCALRALLQLSTAPTLPKHVVVFDMNTNTASNYTGLLGELQQQSPLRIDAYFAIDSTLTTDTRGVTVNGTFVALVKGEGYSRSGMPGSNLVCVDLQVDSSTGAVVNASLGLNPITPIPAFLRDSNYYADVAFSQALAEQAIVNDPIVGYTTEVPLISDLGIGINNCLAGDCGIGNLLTDAFRWQMDSDVALCNSGGVRGAGWPGSGARKYSDILAANPWPNTMNVATLTGLSLWQALNASLSVPMTNASAGGSSSVHLQISGLRVTYGFYLSPIKILSCDVLNRDTGVWEPLNRLKLYKVVMPSFETCCVEPYATIMKSARYRGETTAVNYLDLTLQRVVSNYLGQTTTAANPYVVKENTRHTRVDTGVTSANVMNWHQVQADCPVNTFWDAGVATCMACPLGLVQPSSGQTTCQPPATSLNVAAVAAPIIVVVVISIAVIAAAVARSRANARSTANAPTSGRVTIMFTDIQDSTRLWGALPMSMNKALGLHHELIRAAIAKHKGYEVKTIGDSFMIAVSSEATAVQMAVDIQRSLQAASWPPCIARAYAAKSDEELELLDDDPAAEPIHDAVFNGLRVRIGIHSGEPKAELDPVTKGYDYYGPMVNVAARVESAAKGGQICCSTDVITRLPDKTGLALRSLGAVELKGVAEAVELMEVMPEELAASRRFAYGDNAVKEVAGDTNSDLISETSSNVSHFSDTGAAVRPQIMVSCFLRSLLKTVPSADAKKLRTVLFKAWHVPEDHHAGTGSVRGDADLPLERLCKRVLPSAMRQAKKRADGEGRASGSASSKQTGVSSR